MAELLPVLDDIERAREHGELEGAFKSVGESLEGALAKMGLESRPSSPAELAALLKRDTERWAPLIQQIGFTAES
jgi:tripartite-type tricarboxylate transporter receptor subunit TctC